MTSEPVRNLPTVASEDWTKPPKAPAIETACWNRSVNDPFLICTRIEACFTIFGPTPGVSEPPTNVPPTDPSEPPSRAAGTAAPDVLPAPSNAAEGAALEALF